ncbi:MAG TPA: sigma-70 family RNA polymerase sigma factor [Candidatus Aminicenantes bacterium]|nr:sigma-70 family RNA polymerase sigma factor [Candidatus Aminicenantes bacterium]
MNEEKLIQACLDGNNEAFEVLVKKYYRKVFQLALSLTRNPAEADDLAQEVFIKAYTALPSFRGKSSFSTWLYQITLNHIRDHHRKQARTRTESWPIRNHHLPVETSQPTEKPQEVQQLIQRALQKLPDKFRLIITLRDVHGFSYEEISNILNISPGTVDSRLHRARKKLRQELLPFLKEKGGQL